MQLPMVVFRYEPLVSLGGVVLRVAARETEDVQRLAHVFLVELRAVVRDAQAHRIWQEHRR
jgi:hypothetical protein